MRCDLQIFSGCVCHLEQLHAQSPFLFPIVLVLLEVCTTLGLHTEFLSFLRNFKSHDLCRSSGAVVRKDTNDLSYIVVGL